MACRHRAHGSDLGRALSLPAIGRVAQVLAVAVAVASTVAARSLLAPTVTPPA